MQVESFVVRGLGHSSYLIYAEGSQTAAVLDPKRDVWDYLAAAERRGVRITHIFETHNHNDFVSGSLELASATGAQVCAAAESGISYQFLPLREGQVVQAGGLAFEVIATPGHTPAHVSFIVKDRRAEVLFSGGSLLVGTAGRTDLLGSDQTDALTRLLYHTLRRLAQLPASTILYPTHGSGSFCASGSTGDERSSTIGRERLSNPALRDLSEEQFVRQQTSGLGSFPSYYQFMRGINTAGPRLLHRLPDPHPLSVERVRELLDRDHLLVDGRRPRDFNALHIARAYNVELGDQFASWVGWITPFNAPMLLVLGNEEEDWHEANTQLLRIGYEQVAGHLAGGLEAWRAAGLPVQTTEQIKAHDLLSYLEQNPEVLLLDVRNESEWQDFHLPQAQHLEAGLLTERLGELPRDRPILTVCAAGFRSSISASILQHAGFPNVLTTSGGMNDLRETARQLASEHERQHAQGVAHGHSHDHEHQQ